MTSSGLIRALLNASVERIVRDDKELPDWYRAWCDRVHLRNRDPMGVRDLLVTGLTFAADPSVIIDPAVIARDLRALSRVAEERSWRGLLVLIDDADPLLEDVTRTEQLTAALGSVPGWTLVLATRPSGLRHLQEAVSPCLRHAQWVPLVPFWAPDQVRTCLSAPLTAAEGARLIPEDAHPLLDDLVQLTSGNPFEIALAARHLWYACELGEQEHYELTPRVLERFVSESAMFTGAEDDVITGSLACRRLAPDQLGPALRLIAFSRMSTRQIAVARLLGVPSQDGSVSDRLLSADIDAEEARAVEELEQLEQVGIVNLGEDGHFTVQGGRATEIALKYEARSVVDTADAEQVVRMPFLASVGSPLANEVARRACSLLGDTRRLASLGLYNPTSLAAGARLRASLSAQPFTGLDRDAVPLDPDGVDALVSQLIEPTGEALVLVNLTLAADHAEFDCVDVWLAPQGVESHDVHTALSDALEDREPLIARAGISWKGSRCRVFSGDEVGPALVQLVPQIAGLAVSELFRGWWSGDRAADLDPALQVAEVAVEAMKAHRVPDWER